MKNVRTGRIDSLDRWEKAKAYFLEHNYEPWQYQYGPSEPQGLHVVFSNWVDDHIEVITFSEAVGKEIAKYAAEFRRRRGG
jgi:hypothetical protein